MNTKTNNQWKIWVLQRKLANMDCEDDHDDDAYEEAQYDLADLGEYHPTSGRW